MGFVGVHECIQALGLQTYSKNGAPTHARGRRPIFHNEAVIQLYKTDIERMFHDIAEEDLTRERHLPSEESTLLDSDLDEVLARLGPEIWPPLATGADRSHLRKPDPDTSYKRDLQYPHDKKILKQLLRALIMAKKPWEWLQRAPHRRPKQEPEEAVVITSEEETSGEDTPEENSSVKDPGAHATSAEASIDFGAATNGVKVSPGLAVWGGNRNAPRQGAYQNTVLRLFTAPTRKAPNVELLGTIFMTGCSHPDECFGRIGDETHHDSSWMEFHMPEDMSSERIMRVERGVTDSVEAFNRVLDVLDAAPVYPGQHHRIIEVEYGIDIP